MFSSGKRISSYLAGCVFPKIFRAFILNWVRNVDMIIKKPVLSNCKLHTRMGIVARYELNSS